MSENHFDGCKIYSYTLLFLDSYIHFCFGERRRKVQQNFIQHNMINIVLRVYRLLSFFIATIFICNGL
jgi:hypothetical protein